jgi:MurNAc alpha-1-phosphate uridylyltransferase
MQPLSATTPKPLVRVGGRPLIDHCLDGLAAAGIGTAVVNVHHLADRIEDHLASRHTPRILVSDERNLLLDTGGGVKKALSLTPAETVLLRNSDSFWIEEGRLAEAWDGGRMDILLLLAAPERAAFYKGRGDFTMDAAGRLRRRSDEASPALVYAGAAILHRRIFASAPEGAFSLNVLFDRAIAEKRLFGVEMRGLWINVETPEAVAAADRALAATAA